MSSDWRLPDDLSADGRAAAKAIVSFLAQRDLLDTGGCRPFYSPTQWAERGEIYGLGSLLIVVHDGGDHAIAFDWNRDFGRYEMIEALESHLRPHFYVSQCTSWYSAVYPL